MNARLRRKFSRRVTAQRVSIFAATVVLAAAVCGCSIGAPIPAPSAAISPDPEVNRMLAVSCYSCHTTEGSEEFIARLQPSRWFGHDPALEQLNFSQWDSFDAQRRADAARQIAAAVNDSTMPPSGYLMFHSEARLGAEQKAAITRWANALNAVPAH